MAGSDSMAAERMRLERCVTGDRILLGFERRNEAPAVEHIQKIVKGCAPSWKVLFAKRVDGAAGAAYDYVTRKVETKPQLRGEGNCILLRCTADRTNFAYMLQSAFDFGEKLPGEGLRIFYYSDSIKTGQWFEVAGARMRLKAEAGIGVLEGTFYPDWMKMLHAIEWLSQPAESVRNMYVKAMKERIRSEVMKEAYYAHKMNARASPETNWYDGQRRQVARIIDCLNGMRERPDVRLSGSLRTDGLGWTMPDEGQDTVLTAACVLEALRGNSSIHLTPAIVPYGPYINGLLVHNR